MICFLTALKISNLLGFILLSNLHRMSLLNRHANCRLPEFDAVPTSASRSVVLGLNGAVATSQPLASEIGINVLRQGGNAVDAAIAVAAALAVTEPCSTGLGGDCFMLIYEEKTKLVHSLNGSGRCPKLLTLEKAVKDTGRNDELPNFHAHTVTVPGAAAAWHDALALWGSKRLSFEELLEPAALLAERGFPVSPVTASQWNANAEQYRRDSCHTESEQKSFNDTFPPQKCGQVFKNPHLATVLRTLGVEGKNAFYNGCIAQEIVDAVARSGGVLSMEDMADHKSTFPDPIYVDYNGIRVYEAPPNGQGITALLALNILSNVKDDFPPSNDLLSINDRVRKVHKQIESLRVAFADTWYYCADPDHPCTNIPVEGLLSSEYALERAKLISSSKVINNLKHGYPKNASNTVSFNVVDTEGNAVSFVNSNYFGFGSGIVPSNCGFSLQSRGRCFSLDPIHPNCLSPGKRPYHTIIPCILTDPISGRFYCTLTNMGAFMQPQGHLQLICRLIDEKLDPQTSIDKFRFCILREANGKVVMEHSTPAEIVEGLRKLGHNISVADENNFECFGRAQIIVKDANDVLWAGSDSRADGMAITF